MIITLETTVQEVVNDLSIQKQGQKLIINDVEFDFTNFPDGATLPHSAINSKYFAGNIDKIDGVLHISLTYPILSAEKRMELRYPQPIHVTTDGKVVLPHEQ